MGFFDMLFSGIGSLFSAAVSVVSEVVSTVKTYFTAKEIVTKTVYDERDKKQDQIHELNQEIQFLRRKLNESGRITEQQRKRLYELDEERNFLKQGIKSDSQIIAADRFQQNEDSIRKVDSAKKFFATLNQENQPLDDVVHYSVIDSFGSLMNLVK